MSDNRYNGDGRGTPCPVCDSSRTFVVATRPHDGRTLRLRECKSCAFSFTTGEFTLDRSCGEIINRRAEYAPIREESDAVSRQVSRQYVAKRGRNKLLTH